MTNKFNYTIVSKVDKDTKEHLQTNTNQGIDLYSTGKLDFEDLQNSRFPDILNSLTNEEWEKLKIGGKIIKTETVKTTIEICGVK